MYTIAVKQRTLYLNQFHLGTKFAREYYAYLIVFFGSIFIFMRAFCNLLFGPSVMNPLCSFLTSLHGDTLESGINSGTPPTKGFNAFTGAMGST